MRYDLEDRVVKFGEDIIEFCIGINRNPVIDPLIRQLIRSGTSIGANYMEANAASSKKDFRNKICLCRKEAQETRYWLIMMKKADAHCAKGLDILYKEVDELIRIFGRIYKSSE